MGLDGFFDSGMLLQALKGSNEGEKEGSDRNERANEISHRSTIGRKLQLMDY